ncbi:MAG TPA: hypothetical protein VFD58_34190 [Blastocatellia bacterium]|nr:hypothetical protein [Blastocatellia bacterium]
MMKRNQAAVLFVPFVMLTCVWLGERPAQGQGPGIKSEIVLIGTVHAPTSNFQEETLVRILNRVRPDLILLELDPSFFDSSFNLPEKYQGISLESKAATSYAKTVGARLRPFDIEGRNKFYEVHDYFNRELKLNQEAGRLYAGGQLSPEAKVLFEALLSLSAVRDACGAERPEVINSSACDTAVEKKQYYAFKGLGRIIELTPALKEMGPFWALADEFWVRRNGEMVRNIVRHSKELRPGRAVVLSGYEHRYYLRKQLAGQAAREGFILREYWDY